jgi:3-dehydroquinate synthase
VGASSVVKNAHHSALPPEPRTDAPHTDRIRQSFSVPFEYDVIFTRDALHPSNRALVDVLGTREPSRRHSVLAVVDQGLQLAWPELRGWLRGYFEHHADRISLRGDAVTVVGGEAAKNDPGIVQRLHAVFQGHRLDRHSFVLILGGGAVQDAAGYAAATAHRGIRTVRMPTTVLGQSDSGIGVKNGINLFGSKNFAGTFVPPFAVLNDERFLERLPRRDRIAGLAEAIKVALIRDAQFFAALETDAARLASFDPVATAAAIRRSAQLHLRHIATGGDPFEQGSARPLDFGHWAAHKLETLTSHELRHGEAVAIGLVLDSRYSVEAGLLREADFERIFGVVGRVGLPRWHAALLAPGADGRLAILQGLDDFREHLGGDLTVTLLAGIGSAVDVHEIHDRLVEKALAWLRRAMTAS